MSQSHTRYKQTPASSYRENDVHTRPSSYNYRGDSKAITVQPKAETSRFVTGTSFTRSGSHRILPEEPKSYGIQQMMGHKESTPRFRSDDRENDISRYSSNLVNGKYTRNNYTPQSDTDEFRSRHNLIIHPDSLVDDYDEDIEASKDKNRFHPCIGCCNKTSENQRFRDEIAGLKAKCETLEKRNQFLEQEAIENKQRYDRFLRSIERNRKPEEITRDGASLEQNEHNAHGINFVASIKQGTHQDMRFSNIGVRAKEQRLEQEKNELQQTIAMFKEQLNESEHVKTQLEKQNKELQKKIDDLKSSKHSLQRQIDHLNTENMDVKRRSENITQQMALKTDGSGRSENVNDQFSNSNIARMLDNLYNKEWVALCRTLGKEFSHMNELRRIQILTAVFKRCYIECTHLADTQTQQMLLLAETEKTENIYDRVEFQEILTHRRRYCQKESVRTKVKANVLEHVLSSDEVKVLFDQDSSKSITEKLVSYCNKLIDGCWLVAISHPSIILNFDVVGKSFEDLEQSWMEYSTKHPIEGINQTDGTIVAVVWPSVELKNGSGLYKKGDAIVVKKWKQRSIPQRTQDIGSSKQFASSLLRKNESTF